MSERVPCCNNCGCACDDTARTRIAALEGLLAELWYAVADLNDHERDIPEDIADRVRAALASGGG